MDGTTDTTHNINMNISIQTLDFIDSLGKVIYRIDRDYHYIDNFYKHWIEHISEIGGKSSLVIGAITGYIYCRIIYADEISYDLLPDVHLNYDGTVWGSVLEEEKSPL